MSKGRTPMQLLGEFSAVMRELRDQKIVRSSNNPVADYTELLVCRALGLEMQTQSTAGYDGIDDEGIRYQIKGRRLTPENPSRQMSAIRKLDEEPFDYLIGVLFNEDFSVHKACQVPFSRVPELATYRRHINGYFLLLVDAVWELKEVKDLTSVIAAEQHAMEETYSTQPGSN